MKHSKKHSNHKTKRTQSAGHRKTKHKMSNKKIVAAITIVFVLIAAAVVYVILSTDRVTEGVVGEPDPVFEQCASFCDTNQRNAFCSVNINVNEDLRATCDELATNPDYAQYGVDACASIDCSPTAQELDNTCVTGLNSEWVDPASDGSCPDREGMFVRERDDYSDEPPAEGQVCCFYYE